jgi:threonylcarbamoyladenosine tRNA methylthiotransferase MtaB
MGTPAARMPQLGRAIAKERGQRLRAKGDLAQAARYQQMVGNVHEILMEKGGPSSKGQIGRTRCFAPVQFAGAIPGSFVTIRVTGITDGHLTGSIKA